MATIRPFQAYRPKKELVGKIACKPYDVIDSKEARKEVEGNPFSFLHVVKSEVDLNEEIPIHDPQVYQKARENLDKFIEKGYLVLDTRRCLYIYRQTWKAHTQTGVLGVFSCEEYQRGIIKKHELTRKDKEDDRFNHILTTRAQTGLVFLAFKQNDSLDKLLGFEAKKTPDYVFEDGQNTLHEIFCVSDPERIRSFVQAFEKIPELYIADGHHRSASSSRVQQYKKQTNPAHNGTEEYNFFMAVAFPHNQLKILDYNRVVRDLNGLSKEEFFKKIEPAFDIKKAGKAAFKPTKKHQFGLYIEKEWMILEARASCYNTTDVVESLDVSILQKNLLANVLGIKDPRTDHRIHFVGGIRGVEELEKLVNSGEWKVAFSLFPTTMEDLFAVADKGLIMPPKSTWFEPKLKSGIVVHFIDT